MKIHFTFIDYFYRVVHNIINIIAQNLSNVKEKSFSKLILVSFLAVFTSITVSATEIANDDFSTGLDGWSGTGVTWSASEYIRINRDRTATKTYHLGAANANKLIDIEFRAWANNNWDSSDRFRVYINSTLVNSYGKNNGGYIRKTIRSTTDSNGDITLAFTPDTNNNNERARVYWVTIDTITPDCTTLRDSDNLTSLHTSYTNASHYNSSSWNVGPSATEMTRAYSFTVDGPGTVDIDLSRTDQHQAGLSVSKGSCPSEVSTVESAQLTFASAGTFYVHIAYLPGSHTSIEHQLDVVFTPAPAGPANVCTGLRGLTGVYYNNDTFTTPSALTRIDSNLDFSWGGGSPDPVINADHFSTTWAGTIYIPEDANYIFSIAHDDQMKLIINGLTIYDGTSWTGGSGNFVDAASVALTAGTYHINTTFVEWGGGAYARLKWRNDVSINSSVIIPNINFCTSPLNTPANATADNYATELNTILNGNVIIDDTGAGSDSGTGITVTSNTTPSNGTVVVYSDGTFIYTPNNNVTGADSFTYTITDSSGNTSTATVSIIINDTVFEPDGTTGFKLINPVYTRNVIGDYKISGNTVLCLTALTSGYAASESQCLDTTSPGTRTSNNYVAKFIDIDGDASTWNSSSSNVELPAIYDQQGGYGVLWAGLIWQGRFVWSGTRQSLHYHVDQGATFTTVETGSESARPPVTLSDANVKKIRLKVDAGSYTSVTASKVYHLASSGGFTYTSIANVTSILQNANLAAGKHTFTVANLPTEEGRENTPGVYGGWSLVVIYAENALSGSPKNISIYGGMDKLLNSGDANNRPIEIAGFKLPSSGNSVTAQLSIFSGEGELPYRPDGVQISEFENSGYVNMPVEAGTSQTNIFDAKMNNIDRDNVAGHKNNLQNNNVGVDVDNFDISTIVSGYDRSATSLYLKWYSNGDYIIPGMIAFSTELYKPSLCYDYTFDIGGHVLTSFNNEVNTSYHHYNDTLTTHVAVRSLEQGDFTMTNVSFTAISDPTYLSYKNNTAARAPNLVYGYHLQPIYNKDNPAASRFTMNIGENPGIGSGNGGSINAGQTTFLRFDHNMSTSQAYLEANMTMRVDYTVDYGSGPVNIPQILNSGELCDGGAGAYDPPKGKFNIVGEGASGTNYNMRTQVAGMPYTIRAYGYDTDKVTPKAYDTAIEVEIFNANYFKNETLLSCHNPDSNITSPKFVQFDGVNTYEDVPNEQYNVAKENAGYRIWYLEDPSGGLVLHHCANRNDGGCFLTVYTNNYASDTSCSSECSGGSDCYQCLREYYGKPVCSRDNFAIRPETYIMRFSDVNVSTSANRDIGNSTVDINRSIAGGYRYRMRITATRFNTFTQVPGYVKGFAVAGPYIGSLPVEGATIMNDFNTSAGSCTNLNHEDFGFTFWEGNATNRNIIVRDVGAYRFHVVDSLWTAVDQNDTQPGCIPGSSSTFPNSYTSPLGVTVNGLMGCNITSSYSRNPIRVYDMNLTSFPYDFDMRTVSPATPGSAFVYSNTLGVKNSAVVNTAIDNNMSLQFTGAIDAFGADGTRMTNFTNGCYGRDLNVTLQTLSNPANPTDINGNPIQMRWLEIAATDVNLTDNVLGTTGVIGTPPDARVLATNMTRTAQGRSPINYNINFDRNINVPHNPFTFTTVSMTAQCAVTANCRINAQQSGTYLPTTTQPFPNTVTTVLYGRVNVPRVRSMCNASGNCNGNVTFFYEFYSDRNDANRSVLAGVVGAAPQRSLNSPNWYQNTAHNTATDGSVTAVNVPIPVGTTPVYTQNGTTTTTIYNYTGSRGYPYKATITIPRSSVSGVQPWLVYDKYNPNAATVRGEVEYYGPGEWSSTNGAESSIQGQSDTKRNKNTNRRIRW